MENPRARTPGRARWSGSHAPHKPPTTSTRRSQGASTAWRAPGRARWSWGPCSSQTTNHKPTSNHRSWQASTAWRALGRARWRRGPCSSQITTPLPTTGPGRHQQPGEPQGAPDGGHDPGCLQPAGPAVEQVHAQQRAGVAGQDAGACRLLPPAAALCAGPGLAGAPHARGGAGVRRRG